MHTTSDSDSLNMIVVNDPNLDVLCFSRSSRVSRFDFFGNIES